MDNLPSQPLPAAQAQLSVQVTKLNLTQTLDVGATLPIAWISTGATTHRVQFVVPKPDGTEEITPIITDLGPVQSYTWIISQRFRPQWVRRRAGAFASWRAMRRRWRMSAPTAR